MSARERNELEDSIIDFDNNLEDDGFDGVEKSNISRHQKQQRHYT